MENEKKQFRKEVIKAAIVTLMGAIKDDLKNDAEEIGNRALELLETL